MTKSIILPVVLFVAALCPTAWAHRPIFSDKAATGPATAVPIAQPDVSQVIYRQISQEAPQVWLALDANAGFELFIQIGVPVLDRLKGFRPALTVVGPGLAGESTQIAIPQGMGVSDFPTGHVTEPQFFHEHFTGTDSWILRSETVVLPTAGRYYVVAHVPSKQTGKLWLSIGRREVFGPADLAQFGEWKKRIRRFHEVPEHDAGLGVSLLTTLTQLLQPGQSESQPKDTDPCHPASVGKSSRHLDAVRESADNVLECGRDTYGPKHTPSFVDGLNIHTREPVKWIYTKIVELLRKCGVWKDDTPGESVPVRQ